MVSALIERAKRTPYYHLDGYMLRHWVIPYPNDVGHGTGPVAFHQRPIAWLFQRFNISVRIHEILRSDLGRDPHDHPFNYLTIILRGYYWERRYDDRGRCISHKMHGPGSIIFRRANSWHMLELHQGKVTTLFITGRKVDGHWGFNVNGTKVPRREYEATHGRPWQ